MKASMISRFLWWLTDRLPVRVISGQHGEPYLERYYLCGIGQWRAYLHRFVASDPDRGLHDHPWGWSASLILCGGYREAREDGMHYHRPGAINVIRGETFHRILLDPHATAWTLFVHGPRVKEWGFLRAGKYERWAGGHDPNWHRFALRGWQIRRFAR